MSAIAVLATLFGCGAASRELLASEEGAAFRALLGSDHKYKVHEQVPLYANKVGPFHNPVETYMYYDLPFCRPVDGIEHKPEYLGEVIDGNRLVGTPYNVDFRVDRDHERLCSKELDVGELKKFRKSVADDYYFQMYYDELPIWGFIGKMEKVRWWPLAAPGLAFAPRAGYHDPLPRGARGRI